MGKREALIQATIDVVAQQGIADSPTIQIAKEAGAAELTLFRLFKNKKELLRQTYDEVNQRFQDKCRDKIEPKQNVEKKVVTVLRVIIELSRQHPNELAFFQQYVNSPEGLLQRPDFRYEMGEDVSRYPLVSILDEGKTQGVFKDLPMTALIGLAGAPMIMFLREEQFRKRKHKESDLELLIEACLQAIKA